MIEALHEFIALIDSKGTLKDVIVLVLTDSQSMVNKIKSMDPTTEQDARIFFAFNEL